MFLSYYITQWNCNHFEIVPSTFLKYHFSFAQIYNEKPTGVTQTKQDVESVQPAVMFSVLYCPQLLTLLGSFGEHAGSDAQGF